ncbi:MAG: peptide chain release factor N(5)-glutamine methyltransferase [Spirochaetes bacterium]|nr:MAG: peptide chain release factor N(5)-glutamine methyltransferase [Spirochaetota bacterium]
MKILGNTIRSLIQSAVNSDISGIDAYYLMSYLTKKSKEEILTNINENVSIFKVLKWNRLLRKRKKGIPANYLTGSKEFYSLEFKVNYSVLIPRPETELIVDEVLKLKPDSVLDVGTGSGNIAISVKYYLPICRVTAVDISRPALKVAKYNCKNLLGKKKIMFRKSNFCDNIEGYYDVIVSNPPYIPDRTLTGLQKEVSVYEPRIALSGGKDGLDAYKRIFNSCVKCLNKNGTLILEISNEVLKGVKSLARLYGWVLTKVVKDYSNQPRIGIFKLKTDTKKELNSSGIVKK